LTKERRVLVAVALYLGGIDFRCSVKEFTDAESYKGLQSDLLSSFSKHSSTELIRKLDAYFPGEYYTLRNLFAEQRFRVVQSVTREMYEEQAVHFETFYNKTKAFAMFIKEEAASVPDTFLTSARFALNRAFLKELDKISRGSFPDALESVLDEAEYWGVRPDLSAAEKLIRSHVNDLMSRLASDPTSEALCGEISRYLDLTRDLEIPCQLGEAQIALFGIVNSAAAKTAKLTPGLVELADRLSVKINSV
jgi:hypothetical protein